jgi:hypothetical protein
MSFNVALQYSTEPLRMSFIVFMLGLTRPKSIGLEFGRPPA